MSSKLLYSQRPSKYIERLVLVEMLRHLDPNVAALKSYRYVGFGGLEFADFELFHRSLGIEKMISIEKSLDDIERYEFNRPFQGIEVLQGPAKDHLPGLGWEGLNIVWLDYTSHLSTEVVGDCSTLLRELIPGSVLLVTVNASGGSVCERRENLETNLEPKWIPNISDLELGDRWGVARVQRQILVERLITVANSRADSVRIRQFANFCYKDGLRMQTMGWIVGGGSMDASIEKCQIQQHQFASVSEETVVIELPVLTRREIVFLNKQLPVTDPAGLEAPWLPEQNLIQYTKLYRYYPSELAISALA
ncbi:MAG TPA: O-methyltransferase [archaeon]|nr:O-methyltransferase [archaeon]